MRHRLNRALSPSSGVLACGLLLAALEIRADPTAVALPAGVEAVWDVRAAFRETTPTRERICINGLWQWQPAAATAQQVPAGSWGYYQVPGSWPGISDYLQQDCQTLYAHPDWKDTKLGEVTAAWYRRTFGLPANWAGRRITLGLEYLDSYSVVFVDGARVGEIRFPGGQLDLTSACGPGSGAATSVPRVPGLGPIHTLSLLVVAMPLKGVMLSYTDSASAREVKGAVARRGLCGDVWLVSTPRGPRIGDVRVETSVRKRECAVRASITGLAPAGCYRMKARILVRGRVIKQFTSEPFYGRGVEGRLLSAALSSAAGGGEGARRAGEEVLQLPGSSGRQSARAAAGMDQNRLTSAAMTVTLARASRASGETRVDGEVELPRDEVARQQRPAAFTFSTRWAPSRLWDLDTPQNTYELEVSLMDSAGRVLDTAWTERFGFREFWIDGRDFYLNGTRIFLSAVPLDNAEVSAAAATYAAARESLERLKSFGINYVYTHNYACEPGSQLGFAEILRAADDVGMLVGFSQPHFSHYDWSGPDADQANGYARHAAYYTRAAGNHPSVVMYAMSHNATGYDEDMNPDMIDGIHDARDTWALRNVKLALRAEAIVRSLDPGRIVYHHASGNLGSMHAINFYPNFVPIQELSDWFEHWATRGVKPVFTCEYGAPFTWDWTMYRGWYHGQREFGSAVVPWELCNAEWNAQFVGDRAYQLSEAEKTDLRWEARQFQAGRRWHRWDYPVPVGSTRFDDQYPVFARYLTDNWRAFRTWGVSAISPWEHEHFWKLRDGVDRRRVELKVDWAQLQRPGFSPDYLDQRYQRMDLAFDRTDWVATAAAEALVRNNRPLLAYLAGKPGSFTSKDHNFLAGETFQKEIIVINNSRRTVRCDCRWSLDLPRALTGRKRITVATGTQARIPLRIELPATVSPGAFTLRATVRFSTGETQTDTFTIHVLSPGSEGRPPARRAGQARTASCLNSRRVRSASVGKCSGDTRRHDVLRLGTSRAPAAGASAVNVAVFDPFGQTTELLNRLGVKTRRVEAGGDLSTNDIFIIGKNALTLDGAAPDLRRVRDGLRVIVFEQSSEVLEKRLGFRVEEYGLRRVFPRVANYPALTGLAGENLRDWRGEATLLPPRLKYTTRPRYGPTVEWCGIPVTRAWRCGNRGNVASVLIEKPPGGDFLPVLDGGFSLQYSPLLEYREGRGLVVFCQMDVTGRTESDPAAERLVRNLVRYVADWKP
ncbi:MAG: hypothetical protein KGS61_12035, partial [Verrucomicrobia bacterium]|nr:hypothetical protein [Verrucomicrobiota bacterium]